MEISTQNNANQVIVSVEGRIDTNTAPELEAKLKEIANSTKEIILDFAKVEYVSSAGLRVLLFVHKLTLQNGGKFVIRNVSEEVMEVFDMTGFSSFLVIED